MRSRLEGLAAQVRRELEWLDYPRREWMPQRSAPGGQHLYDVLLVGGGQGGLAAAFGLMRERVGNLLVIDENPPGLAGPWRRFARMRTLRTPKHVLGPDLGVPSLTLRAFYEARHGEGSWEALHLLPREEWAAYLDWYRETLAIPFQAHTHAGPLRWVEEARAFEVPCSGPEGERTLWARRVVLATGIEGAGSWQVPALIRDALPRERYAHTHEDIDFAALAGRRVAVLGAGASAFDNAATALEHGAREVRLFFRRPSLVRVNPYRWAEFAGFLGHHAELSDADRYRFIRQILRMGQLPPADTYRRASEHENFHLHPASAWRQLRTSGDGILLTTDGGSFETDYVIAATGFVTDLAKRPELAHLERHIARWSDRYSPPESERHEDLDRHPYLGPHFELTERAPGEAPCLAHIHHFTFGGLLSLGFGGASISGMKYALPRLVGGVAGSLFREDREVHFQRLCRFDEREF